MSIKIFDVSGLSVSFHRYSIEGVLSSGDMGIVLLIAYLRRGSVFRVPACRSLVLFVVDKGLYCRWIINTFVILMIKDAKIFSRSACLIELVR